MAYLSPQPIHTLSTQANTPGKKKDVIFYEKIAYILVPIIIIIFFFFLTA